MKKRIEGLCYTGPTQRGAHCMHSDPDTETGLTLCYHFRLVLRQSEGFIQALLAMIDVPWKAPDHMTLSRRQTEVSVDLSV